MEGESVEDLLTKLDTYREQLALVENAITQNEDDHLKKLKDDLAEVIMYTEDLVRYKNAASANDDKKPATKSAHAALVGRTCECHWENKWYNGVIQSVRRDERGERCQVQMIGMGISRDYKISEVRLLKPPPPVQCQVGSKVQAIFPEDGLWYTANIKDQTSTGYNVTFDEYGENLDLKFDQVRLIRKEESKVKVKEVITPGGWRVPENLIPKEDDTEKQRALKKRKLHQLKGEQRKEAGEKAMTSQANSWMKFKTKSSAKSRSGFMTGKSKDSIFKSPDTIEGKVGVTNSGNNMTKFTERSKFTYDNK